MITFTIKVNKISRKKIKVEITRVTFTMFTIKVEISKISNIIKAEMPKITFTIKVDIYNQGRDVKNYLV